MPPHLADKGHSVAHGLWPKIPSYTRKPVSQANGEQAARTPPHPAPPAARRRLARATSPSLQVPHWQSPVARHLPRTQRSGRGTDTCVQGTVPRGRRGEDPHTSRTTDRVLQRHPTAWGSKGAGTSWWTPRCPGTMKGARETARPVTELAAKPNDPL